MIERTANLLIITLIVLVINCQLFASESSSTQADDVPEFFKFCDTHFAEGLKVAAICECINRKVAFVPEGEFKDRWQQPKDTLELGSGDCEDVVLLFAYLARHSRIPATYCWGECLNGAQVLAHAWVELESKEHITYIVEFFGNNTPRCIFPQSEDKWLRRRHVMITHGAFCVMAETGFERQKNVFNKLNETFTKIDR